VEFHYLPRVSPCQGGSRSEAAKLMTPEELYRRLGRIIEECPAFGGVAPLSAEQLTWLGRAEALVAESKDNLAQAEFAAARGSLAHPTMRPAGHQNVMMSLYRVLGKAELASPPSVQGAFIPVGSVFDAYAAVAKIFAAATSDLLVIDPYMDDTALLDFAGAVPDNVVLRLLSDFGTAKPTLGPAATKWSAQYPQRKLAVRLAPARTLHDRAILVDGKEAWTVTQSLKDLAKRSPAEIVRAADTADLKIAAYEQIWKSAGVLI
jgi:hypothetical protein